MTYQDVQENSGLTDRLARGLRIAGHPAATVKLTDCEGYALCTIDGLELEPEQVMTLARALRLIGYSNKKLFAALGVIEEYAT